MRLRTLISFLFDICRQFLHFPFTLYSLYALFLSFFFIIDYRFFFYRSFLQRQHAIFFFFSGLGFHFMRRCWCVRACRAPFRLSFLMRSRMRRVLIPMSSFQDWWSGYAATSASFFFFDSYTFFHAIDISVLSCACWFIRLMAFLAFSSSLHRLIAFLHSLVRLYSSSFSSSGLASFFFFSFLSLLMPTDFPFFIEYFFFITFHTVSEFLFLIRSYIPSHILSSCLTYRIHRRTIPSFSSGF